jgi:predicted 3-demethylubiquinone-9 3-methyltransferase (glyoxalase superfamily)
MQKIVPCLWFNGQAEEAVNHYVSILPDSKIVSIARFGDAGPGSKGDVLTVNFQLAGQDYIALNGGPEFRFTEAISLLVNCETQQEVDTLWERLLEGGEESQCGWLKDKYGLSWQIIPTALSELLEDPDPEKANRVMRAMLKMSKIDIADMRRAQSGQ